MQKILASYGGGKEANLKIKTALKVKQAFKEQLQEEFSLLRILMMRRIFPELQGELYVFSRKEGGEKFTFAAAIEMDENGQIQKILTDVR